MQEKIEKILEESANIKRNINIELIKQAVEVIIEAYKKNKKVLIFGNGGSAADAQHFAGELIGRFKKERKSLGCIALTTDTSILTAVGNDYGFEYIFKRQLEGLLEEEDIVIGISTSGESENVIEAIKYAKEKKAKTIGLCGKSGGRLKNLVDICIWVKSDNTPRIQEAHITILHIIAELVEEALL
jgi:D-sedoheptulose 7-phosphate isomerase